MVCDQQKLKKNSKKRYSCQKQLITPILNDSHTHTHTDLHLQTHTHKKKIISVYIKTFTCTTW